MARYVALRRHTDNDGDVLTPEGIRAALDIGRRLSGDYHVLVSTGGFPTGPFGHVHEAQLKTHLRADEALTKPP